MGSLASQCTDGPDRDLDSSRSRVFLYTLAIRLAARSEDRLLWMGAKTAGGERRVWPRCQTLPRQSVMPATPSEELSCTLRRAPVFEPLPRRGFRA